MPLTPSGECQPPQSEIVIEAKPREREGGRHPDLGRVVAIAVFFGLIVLNVAGLRGRSSDGTASLAEWMTSLLTLTFYAVLTVAYFRRTQAKATDRSWRAWAVAFLGTAAPFLLPLLAAGRTSNQALYVVASTILVVGLALMIWALSYLSTNISVVPQARSVVTTGPYAYVRHPLYAAELVNVLGICLSLTGVLPWVLFGAWILLQVARARNEESLLLEELTGYAEYSRHTPMLIPFLKAEGPSFRTLGWRKSRARSNWHEPEDDV